MEVKSVFSWECVECCRLSSVESKDSASSVQDTPYFKGLDNDKSLVETIDPERYLGLWYEYATIPAGHKRVV